MPAQMPAIISNMFMRTTFIELSQSFLQFVSVSLTNSLILYKAGRRCKYMSMITLCVSWTDSNGRLCARAQI